MLPFLLLLLALFVPILQCVDAVNHKAIFACVGLVTIQDHLQIDQVHNEIEDFALKAFLSKNRLKQFRRRGARNRVFRQRRSWQNFQSLLTNRQFRRYFRMSRECFALLANKIEQNVGAEVFKSEEYLTRLKSDPNFSYALFNKQKNLLAAHEHTTGGFISGEVKLAITLRMLAGGSYLDLALLYEMGQSTAHVIFHQVVDEWINDKRLVDINGMKYISDEGRMTKVALGFAQITNGALCGCIGALDGWIVKIQRPTKKRDKCPNPSSYYSRKGYYGINVQAIVDSKKRILFRSILTRGAEHDSTAFKSSNLHKRLLKKYKWYFENGLYFIGDSAYGIKSFLLTPYDNVLHGTDEDNYNFFHSSARIWIECAFGEIDLRWGILWRPLKFSLKHNIAIIDACMRMHNFIVDFRESNMITTSLDRLDKDVFDEDCRRFLQMNMDICSVGVHGGEEDMRRDERGDRFIGGRPLLTETEARKIGMAMKDAIRDELARTNFTRPNNRILNK